jgi:hypothetical protein
MILHKKMAKTVDQGPANQRRDALLLKLLRTPHQPRPKRDRGIKKNDDSASE